MNWPSFLESTWLSILISVSKLMGSRKNKLKKKTLRMSLKTLITRYVIPLDRKFPYCNSEIWIGWCFRNLDWLMFLKHELFALESRVLTLDTWTGWCFRIKQSMFLKHQPIHVLESINPCFWSNQSMFLKQVSVIQFLREIKIGKSRDSKFAIFTHLEVWNFDLLLILALLEG